MQMLWRRFRCAKCEPPPKERWAYVGRARVKGAYDKSFIFWVYLHPTKDEWWFLRKPPGFRAHRAGGYREWSRYYEFEPLVNKEN